MEEKVGIESYSEALFRIDELGIFKSVVSENFDYLIDNLTIEDAVKDSFYIRFSEKTPVVFLMLGLVNLPFEMASSKLAKGLFLDHSENNGHFDRIDKLIVKYIAYNLGNPLAIFKSASRKNRYVAIYNILDKKQSYVMIAIEPKGQRDYVKINLILSIYGRNNESVYKRWIDEGLLIYYNDLEKGVGSSQLQLPSVLAPNKKLLLKSQVVNSFNRV